MLFVVDHVASYISIFTYWLVHCTHKISGTHLSVNVTGTGKQHQLETPCSKYKRINIFFSGNHLIVCDENIQEQL